MKLSVKIFLGICIPSIIAIIIISSSLIFRSLKNNIENETNRCIQEFRLIEYNIEDAFKNSTSIDKEIIKAYSDYYSDKQIDFIYYENKQEVYKSENNLKIHNLKILDVTRNNVLTEVQNMDDQYFVLISTKLSNGNILIYVRNIDSIYKIKDNLINLSIIVILIIIVLIAVIAYVISRTLTKPLNKMKVEMLKLSKGDYNINLKEGKDEFGNLARNFNKMSKELENRNKELVEMITSKEVFIDNLSHEINTPLTSIIGYSELLEKANCTDEQKQKFLKYIQQESKRINDIHKKLLLLSYKKKADFDAKHIEVINVFSEIEKLVRFKLEENNINLQINSSLKTIYGDETLIIMSISNLISNAINVSKNGSRIIVNAFEDNNNKYIQVIDEGQGISKENIRKIVEPFYRVDKARSRKNGGAGLGLSICQSIMELHNGNMKIDSELGKGSIFTLEFPNM